MQTTQSGGKAWRVIAIILVGMTAAMNLLGGIGTTCAAFFTKQYPPMWALFDYRWLYQAFVVLTALVGLAGIWSVVKLIRGGEKAYRNALIVLGIGAVINVIHVVVSISLRGKATPADVVMAINLVTLLVVAYLGTPGMRAKVHFDRAAGPGEKAAAGGMAAIVSGLITLTTPLWAGPTHMFDGVNWVNLLIAPLILAGGALLLIGALAFIRLRQREMAARTQSQSTPAIRAS